MKEKKGLPLQEGCGKDYPSPLFNIRREVDGGEFIKCRKGYLCPLCSPQSPRFSNAKDNSSGELASELDSGDNSPRKGSALALKSEDTKTLSSKIVEADNVTYDNGFFWEEDVKDFIKKVLDIGLLETQIDRIKNLAGKHLIKLEGRKRK